MNDRIKELVSEVLSFDEVTRKEFELELRTGKKEITATKKELIKEQKKKSKEEGDIFGRKTVNEIGIDGEITVDYKDGTLTGSISKIGEKTFTIKYLNEDNEEKSLFRYYHQVTIETPVLDDVTQE